MGTLVPQKLLLVQEVFVSGSQDALQSQNPCLSHPPGSFRGTRMDLWLVTMREKNRAG